MRSIALTLSFLLCAPLTAGVIDFSGYPNHCSGFDTDCQVGSYVARGVTFSPVTQAVCAGNSNGDPGGWGLEGPKGSHFLCFNGVNPGNVIDVTFNSPRRVFGYASRASGSSTAATLDYSGSLATRTIYGGSHAFSEVNTWLRFAFPGIDRLTLAGSASNPWGLDGLVYKSFRGDFFKESRGDLLWLHESTGEVALWNMSYLNVSGSAYIEPARAGRRIVAVEDFNGDGSADYLQMVGREVSVSLRDGYARIAEEVIATLPYDWRILGAGDMNGDDRADVALRQDGTNKVVVWFLDGAAITSSSTILTMPPGWASLGLGDFNGDGMSDLVWRHETTNELAIWIMSGAVVTHAAIVAVPPSDWTLAAIADVTADGTDDLLWRHTSGQLVYWRMLHGSIAGTASIAHPAPEWRLVASPDLDGDGKSDLVWRNSSTGQNVGWLMQGATIDASAYLPTVTDAGWTVAGPR